METRRKASAVNGFVGEGRKIFKTELREANVNVAVEHHMLRMRRNGRVGGESWDEEDGWFLVRL